MIARGRQSRLFERLLSQICRDAESVLDVGTSQRFAKELRPYEAWFYRVKPAATLDAELAALMDVAAYEKHVESVAH